MTAVSTENRRLYKVQLRPLMGDRFQPTGFPDIGPAEFQRPNEDGEGVKSLLVESPQSMANRLESQGWDEARQVPVDVLQGLPYVRVLADDDGAFLTSSRTESHRLGSVFVKESKLEGESMTTVIKERLGLRDDTPLNPAAIASVVMGLDPLCLVHGVFFADKLWPGQPRVARAVTGFIEAQRVSPVFSGGVKRDHVRHGNVEGGGAKEGYGSIPFHRTEYVAEEITAYFTIDLAQIRSYGLGKAATTLLDTIARWEIRSFLESGLRLRTACDLEPVDDTVIDQRGGEELPSAEELASAIRSLVPECADLLGDGAPIEVRWTSKGKKADDKDDNDSE